jgi:hypothetical protein
MWTAQTVAPSRVRRNLVAGQITTPKNGKARRVDMSVQLQGTPYGAILPGYALGREMLVLEDSEPSDTFRRRREDQDSVVPSILPTIFTDHQVAIS